MSDKQTSIMLICGEHSGDLLGADLAKSLLAKHTNLRLSGVGGRLMEAAGVHVDDDMSMLSIIGFVEVIQRFSSICQLMRRIQARLLANPPDLLILIDAPGFNLRLARFATAHRIPVLYYVGPQWWAWRKGRIKTIKATVDHMAVLLPFEPKLYQAHQVPVSLIQHPLYVQSRQTVDRSSVFSHLSLNTSKKILVFMPGSRRSELKRHFSIIIQVAELWQKKHHDWQYICLKVDHLSDDYYAKAAAAHIQLVSSCNHELLSVADACVCCSGTATLEVALHQVPMVIMYKTSWVNYLVARAILKVKFIGLCNLVVDYPLAEELIQSQATPTNIINALERILNPSNKVSERPEVYSKLLECFSAARKSESLAEIALKLIDYN